VNKSKLIYLLLSLIKMTKTIQLTAAPNNRVGREQGAVHPWVVEAEKEI